MAETDAEDVILRLNRKIQHLEAENERLTAQLVYARASLFTRVGAAPAGSSGTLRSPGGVAERSPRPASSPPARPSVSRIADASTPAIDLAAALAQTPGPGEELCDNWYVSVNCMTHVELLLSAHPFLPLMQWQGGSVWGSGNAPPALLA